MREEEEEKNERGFRIVDRRRFDAEGVARDGSSDEPAEPTPTAAPAPAPAPQQAPAEPAPAGMPVEAAPDEPTPGMDFMSFVASMATNAMAALGALPPGSRTELPRDPELAREYIDILVMLHHKTRGNLSQQEDSTLVRLLTDLGQLLHDS